MRTEDGRPATAQFRGSPVSIQGRGKESEMLLKDKVAVIYGAGGAIGGAVTMFLIISIT